MAGPEVLSAMAWFSPTDFANRDFGRRLPRARRDILFPLFNAAN
jgi:hypothetical protein